MTPSPTPDRSLPGRPLRVLHLAGTLDRGGIETWLVNLLAQLPREEVAMDVMVVSPDPRPGEYAERVRGLGATLLVAPATGNPLAFAAFFVRALRRHGPYDVIHSHIHHFGGLALLLARLSGVPVRVATSHLDSRRADMAATGGRYAYLSAMRAALGAGITHRHAVSPEAAAALYGPDWQARGAQVVTLGVDLQAVRHPGDLTDLRTELGLTPGMPVFGHVGQFRPQKNHLLLLEAFAAYLERHGPAQLLLVGDGPERAAIEERVAALGLKDRVRLLGSRPDVARLLWIMDAFVFPSHFEGLSLALVEAQAAGLPRVISAGVYHDARMQDAGLQVLPLTAPPAVWADALAQAASRGREVPDHLEFDIVQEARKLGDFYRAAGEGA